MNDRWAIGAADRRLREREQPDEHADDEQDHRRRHRVAAQRHRHEHGEQERHPDEEVDEVSGHRGPSASRGAGVTRSFYPAPTEHERAAAGRDRELSGPPGLP